MGYLCKECIKHGLEVRTYNSSTLCKACWNKRHAQRAKEDRLVRRRVTQTFKVPASFALEALQNLVHHQQDTVVQLAELRCMLIQSLEVLHEHLPDNLLKMQKQLCQLAEQDAAIETKIDEAKVEVLNTTAQYLNNVGSQIIKHVNAHTSKLLITDDKGVPKQSVHKPRVAEPPKKEIPMIII